MPTALAMTGSIRANIGSELACSERRKRAAKIRTLVRVAVISVLTGGALPVSTCAGLVFRCRILSRQWLTWHFLARQLTSQRLLGPGGPQQIADLVAELAPVHR